MRETNLVIRKKIEGKKIVMAVKDNWERAAIIGEKGKHTSLLV